MPNNISTEAVSWSKDLIGHLVNSEVYDFEIKHQHKVSPTPLTEDELIEELAYRPATLEGEIHSTFEDTTYGAANFIVNQELANYELLWGLKIEDTETGETYGMMAGYHDPAEINQHGGITTDAIVQILDARKEYQEGPVDIEIHREYV